MSSRKEFENIMRANEFEVGEELLDLDLEDAALSQLHPESKLHDWAANLRADCVGFSSIPLRSKLEFDEDYSDKSPDMVAARWEIFKNLYLEIGFYAETAEPNYDEADAVTDAQRQAFRRIGNDQKYGHLTSKQRSELGVLSWQLKEAYLKEVGKGNFEELLLKSPIDYSQIEIDEDKLREQLKKPPDCDQP